MSCGCAPRPGDDAELRLAFKSLPAPVANNEIVVDKEPHDQQVVFKRNPDGSIKSATIAEKDA
jgi:hypothetical protein